MLNLEELSKITDKGSVQILSAEDFTARRFNMAEAFIPLYIYGINNGEEVVRKLLDMYSPETEVFVLPEKVTVKLTELSSFSELVVMPSESYIERKRFTFGDLVEIIRRLRDEDGCPWDKAQTHKTIRGNVIEEAYELTEAIDLNSVEKMREESGDVLLQGLFHSTIAEDNGEFNTNDMISELCTKLIFRHTHIFGKNKANNADEALKFWEQAKAKEKGQKSTTDKIASIPVTFSALMRANKVQKYAAKVGFDFPDIKGAEEKLFEEIKEFEEATGEDIEKEGGDVLFAAINVLRLAGVDPEVALTGTNLKFIKRFTYVEECAKVRGLSLTDVSLDAMDSWYNEYKAKYEHK